jgi:hypothetical protein
MLLEKKISDFFKIFSMLNFKKLVFKIAPKKKKSLLLRK